ncbi:MAG TPA: PIN domain-containing protein [Thermoanaerobaculia bacterium]|nr:PIN domain-containing protein [Thermoanaerobaculia bacterium]
MRFWDTSALFPLIFRESSSGAMRRLFTSDDAVLVSFLTPLELQAAVRRRTRLLNADAVERIEAGRRLLESRMLVIDDAGATVATAREILVTHALRAADAVQLAAALIARAGGPRFDFVSLDTDLSAAARAEGFPVLS